MGKRKNSDPEDHIDRKIKKLERKMEKLRKKRRRYSLSESSESDLQTAPAFVAISDNDYEPQVEPLQGR